MTHTINHKEYVEFSGCLKTKYDCDKLLSKIKMYGGMLQSFKNESSFWKGTEISFVSLIPSEKAVAFSNTEMKH